MPPRLKKAGKYRLVFTVQSGNDVVKRTLVVEIVGKRARKTPKLQVDIVLAGNGHIRKDVAAGLADDGIRVVAAGDTDAAFDLTGNARRNVQVILVDVDRYGVELVRDLHMVFPGVRILALTNDPRKLALAMKAGATIAVPRTTPPDQLAKLIERLARRR